jgi:hypothetical protein
MCAMEFTASKGCRMASTAGQISRDLFCFDFRRFFAACAPAQRRANGGVFAAEDLTALALAKAGIASLLALPALLLASLFWGAPLAVPAALCLGYIAVSHAVAAGHRRRADLIGAAVLCGLVGWLLVFLLLREGSLSRGGLAVALMSPLFAAAPAFARSFIVARAAAGQSPYSSLREAALERAACLDELTPSEQVLLLDASGAILATTHSARKAFRMLPDAFEHHLNLLFEAEDLRRLLTALDRCTESSKSVELDGVRPAQLFPATERGALPPPQTGATTSDLSARLSRCADGSIAMRLEERRVAAAPVSAVEEATSRSIRDAQPRCDVDEAMAFALRHAKSKAGAKNVSLSSVIEPGLVITCDRQVGRRTVGLLIDAALNGSTRGSAVEVVARRLKGVVLVRASSKSGTGARENAESEDRLDIADLRLLVEGAGGTLVVDRDGNEVALSVRLDLAAGRLTKQRMDEPCQS